MLIVLSSVGKQGQKKSKKVLLNIKINLSYKLRKWEINTESRY